MTEDLTRKRSTLPKAVAVFVSGVLLWQVLEVVIGIGAAVAIPRSYLEAFPGKRDVAMFLADLAVIAMPTFLVCAVWAAATLWAAKKFLRSAALWLVAGFTAALLWTLVTVGISYAETVNNEAKAGVVLRFLFATLVPADFWSVPRSLAPWVGIAVGAWCVALARESSNQAEMSSH